MRQRAGGRGEGGGVAQVSDRDLHDRRRQWARGSRFLLEKGWGGACKGCGSSCKCNSVVWCT